MAFKASPSSQHHLHCTDEAQKAETVLAAVIYIYICMHACMNYMHELHVCMYVCMYACMHACMHACSGFNVTFRPLAFFRRGTVKNIKTELQVFIPKVKM